MNNFNFKYAYDYFFNPEKVKGQPYKPLRSPGYKEAVLVNEGSEATKKNTADKNIHFFEDFSTTSCWKKTNWLAKHISSWSHQHYYKSGWIRRQLG